MSVKYPNPDQNKIYVIDHIPIECGVSILQQQTPSFNMPAFPDLKEFQKDVSKLNKQFEKNKYSGQNSNSQTSSIKMVSSTRTRSSTRSNRRRCDL